MQPPLTRPPAARVTLTFLDGWFWDSAQIFHANSRCHSPLSLSPPGRFPAAG